MTSVAQTVNPTGYDGGDYSYVRSMYQFYYTDWNVNFLTRINETIALTWGFGSGVSSQKMTVSPSVKLGFVYVFGITENRHPVYGTEVVSFFTLGASRTFGGSLSERSCTDDRARVYNCRTALSVVDTPLFYQDVYNRTLVTLRYTLSTDFF